MMRVAFAIVFQIGILPAGTLGQANAGGQGRGRDQGDGEAPPTWSTTPIGCARLEKVRRRYALRELGAAVVVAEKVVAASEVGIRKYGTRLAVGRDEPLHLGSITKVMSATLIGVLIDDGDSAGT
jgi:CubicO group peptidase (beta-lactamase class C family)